MALSLDPSVWQRQAPDAATPDLDASACHLWLFSLDQPAWPVEAIEGCLDDVERARAARFHFEIHRRRFITGRGQLRLLLSGYTGIPAGRLRFDYGTQGKPRLARGQPDACPVEFNLSHTEGIAMLGIDREAEIGVDVEMVRAMEDAGSIARDNFSASEVAVWESLPQSDRSDGFFACWTRKEAVVKALGGGLSIPLDSFQVTLKPAEPAQLVAIGGTADTAGEWSMWGERVLPECWAAAAVQAPRKAVARYHLAA